MSMDLNALAIRAHRYAVNQGFWALEFRPHGESVPANLAEKLCLIHLEVSEALEALREGTPLDEELADIMIRVGDLAGFLNIDLGKAVVDKMLYNETREYKHGKRF